LKAAYTDPIKSCYSVSYSDGGHLLAAANFSTINLYNPNSFELVNTLQAHQGYIKRLKWAEDDTVIISFCSMGVLYSWNVFQGNRIVQHSYKQTKYNTMVYDN